MEPEQLQAIIDRVIKELEAEGLLNPSRSQKAAQPSPGLQPAANLPLPASPNLASLKGRVSETDLHIDLEDPSAPKVHQKAGIDHPQDVEGLTALMNTTPARIGLGRAGPRIRTASLLLFQADLAVTQDALYREVNASLLEEMSLFEVSTCITGGKQEYLLRPDLGRKLSDEARDMINERCVKNPNVQVCAGDGLSATAIESNLGKIFPVLQNGCKTARLSMGTPFFIQYCRVGVMNDIGDLLHPDVLILLIGERPGLGRAESMSAYMAYRSHAGQTDADRDVICNIFDNGGTNPLEAGAYAVQLAQKMKQKQASGIKLRMLESS